MRVNLGRPAKVEFNIGGSPCALLLKPFSMEERLDAVNAVVGDAVSPTYLSGVFAAVSRLVGDWTGFEDTEGVPLKFEKFSAALATMPMPAAMEIVCGVLEFIGTPLDAVNGLRRGLGVALPKAGEPSPTPPLEGGMGSTG